MNYLRMGRTKEAAVSRINWTESEKNSVAAEAFRQHCKDPSLSIVAVVSRAQIAVLPPARHRPIEKAHGRLTAWLTPVFAAMKADAEKATRSAAARRNVEALFDQGEIETSEPAENTPADDIAPAVAAIEVESGEDAAQPVEAATTVDISSAPLDMQSASFDIKVTTPEVDHQNIEPTSNRRQVHWKDDERRAVAARAYSNRKQWPDMSKLDAFRKAQDSELPEERRRVLPTWSIIQDWADPMLEALALDEQIEAARIAEERERQREDARRQAEREEAARVAQERADADQKAAFERAVSERMQSLGVDELLSALCRKIGRDIYEGFREGFAASPPMSPPPASRYAPPPPPPSNEPPAMQTPPARQRLPKVCVVGLLNQQENDVERAFLGVMEFEFVKSQKTGGNGHGGTVLADKTRCCDLLVSMVDFAGHDIERHARKLEVPLMRVNGSVSALKRELRTWLDQHGGGRMAA